jgi:hypothetical protein
MSDKTEIQYQWYRILTPKESGYTAGYIDGIHDIDCRRAPNVQTVVSDSPYASNSIQVEEIKDIPRLSSITLTNERIAALQSDMNKLTGLSTSPVVLPDVAQLDLYIVEGYHCRYIVYADSGMAAIECVKRNALGQAHKWNAYPWKEGMLTITPEMSEQKELQRLRRVRDQAKMNMKQVYIDRDHLDEERAAIETRLDKAMHNVNKAEQEYRLYAQKCNLPVVE